MKLVAVTIVAVSLVLCACGNTSSETVETEPTVTPTETGGAAGQGGASTGGSDDSGVADAAVPSSDAISADGTDAPAVPECNIDRANWMKCGNYELELYDPYWIRNNIWGSSQPGAGEQCTWAESERCWGVQAQHLDGEGAVKGYPQVVRGWSLSDGVLVPTSGLGILVGDLRKAHIRWKMTTPPPGGYIRFMALWDIYFHTTPNPTGAAAQINLMIFQKIRDDEGWFGLDTAGLQVVTFDGRPFRMRVSRWGAGTERVVTLFLDPHSDYDFGTVDMTLDLKAVIDSLVGLGHLSATTDYLTSIQAGWEIIQGGEFVTHDFWTAVQDEPDPT